MAAVTAQRPLDTAPAAVTGRRMQLCHAIENERGKDAFLAAYTLQGVCANLCFDKLLASTVQMTALISPETNTITENCYLFLEAVKQDYKLTVSSIRTYLDSEHEE